MFSLIVQTLLLMAIAFILGAILGCLLRSLFGTAEREVVADVQSPVKAVEVPKPPIPEKPVEKAEIFKPVYVPELKAKETPVVKTEPVVAPKPEVVAEPVIVSKPKPKPKVKAKPAAKPKPKAKAKPAAKPKAKPAAKPKAKPAAKPKVKAKPAAKPKAKVKAAAVAKPKAKVKTAAAAKPKAKAKPAAKPKPKPRAPRLKPDNLKLVRGIGPQNEARLNTMGIKQFAQIAAWKKKDTVHYGEALAFPGRIEREEWVKQAKVLAKGGATKFSKRVRSGDVESSLGKAKSVELGKKPRGLRATPRRGKAEDLKEIDGVGPAIEKKLNKAGIHHFDQIAKMTKPELVWLGNAVGYPGTPERENWVKDAKKLATRKSK